MNTVVDNPEGLTAAWLSNALKLDVRSVTVERVGTGQTGAAYRLHFDTPDGPGTLIAKLAAGDEAARGRVRNGYRKEAGFYTDLAGTVNVRTPRCRYAAITPDGLSFTLLLDDLAPLVPGVQVEGCSVAQAEDAVSNLAALHAPRWNDGALFDLPFVSRPTEAGAELLGRTITAAAEQFLDRYRADLDHSDADVLRQSAAATSAWQLVRPEPFTIVHGDYRLDNLLFPLGGGDGVVVVDWQTVTVAPPGRDLAYFMGTCLAVEDRRAAERHLVGTYHAALLQRGVAGYSADRCFEDYRLGHLQGPLITMIG